MLFDLQQNWFSALNFSFNIVVFPQNGRQNIVQQPTGHILSTSWNDMTIREIGQISIQQIMHIILCDLLYRMTEVQPAGGSLMILFQYEHLQKYALSESWRDI